VNVTRRIVLFVWDKVHTTFCARLGEFVVVLCCYCFKFGSVWSSIGLFGRFGVSWLEPV
jgi:hypothetical protein